MLPLRIVAKNADKPVTLARRINYAVCEKLCIPVEANAELAFTSVASTEDSALSAALDTVPKPANVGDPNPLTIRDVKREGKSQVLVDVVDAGCARRQPVRRGTDAGLGAAGADAGRARPARREALRFELDGVPPGANPDGAALKLTLVGGDRAYEFNVNLN